jgi:hypothetical protein
MRFLQQALQAVLELHAVARQLALATRDRPPQTLGDVRHKAEGELVRDQSFHEPFRIREVFLPAAWPVVRLCLREMQRA